MNKVQHNNYISENQNQKILIFVTFPNMIPRKVKVSSSNSIDTLFQFLPNGKKVVFYHGNIIYSSHTFNKYGISDYDRIAIIQEDQISIETEQFWKKATRKDFENKRIFEAFQDPKVQRTISCQQDRAMIQIENSHRSYQNSINTMQFLTTDTYNNEFSTCINWNKTDKPIEITLPKLW
jgi:hypothetical protein